MKKKKSWKIKLHNFFLETTTVIALFVFLFSIACLDSNSNVPIISAGVSLIWLFLFFLANGGEDDVDR